jgi:hypothetical protein
MEPVYAVGRAVGVGKLNDSLWLSLRNEKELPLVTHDNYPARDRKRISRTKKKRLLHC